MDHPFVEDPNKELTFQDIVLTLERAIMDNRAKTGKLPSGIIISLHYPDMSPAMAMKGIFNDAAVIVTMAQARNFLREPELVDIFVDGKSFELP